MADILQITFFFQILNKNLCISPNFDLKGAINNNSTLVQAMAWHQTGNKIQ